MKDTLGAQLLSRFGGCPLHGGRFIHFVVLIEIIAKKKFKYIYLQFKDSPSPGG